MKMIRDLRLFENNPEKLKMFEILNESDDDLQYQRQVQIILEQIQLQDAINEHVNKHFNKDDPGINMGWLQIKQIFALGLEKKF